MRLALLLLLALSACANVPAYESPYAQADELYGPPYPVAADARCNPNYLTATPSPLGLYSCPMPLLWGYSPYGYAAPFYAAGFVRHAHKNQGTHHTHSGGRRGRK